MIAILDEFRINHLLPDFIKQEIKHFHIKDSCALALCVTKCDKVYAFGDEFHKVFDYPEPIDGSHYALISELCDQNIHEFFFSQADFIFALSVDKKIFGWGENNHGQLARGYVSEEDQFLRPEIVQFFSNKYIVDISCGWNHCLALSEDGGVYGWGDNSLRQLISLNRAKEILVPTLLNNYWGEEVKIINVNCYEDTSLLVKTDGSLVFLYPEQFPKRISGLSSIENANKIIQTYSMVGVLNQDGLFQCYHNDNNNTQILSLNDQFVTDINLDWSNESIVIETRSVIFKINEINVKFISLNYRTLFDYFLAELQSTHKTIHVINNEIFADNEQVNTDESSKINIVKKRMPVFANFEDLNRSNCNDNSDSLKLKKFRIFNFLPESHESNVKFIHYFGWYASDSYSAIFVMNNNKVYGFGDNFNGILGLGHNRTVTDYTLIHELCDENIEEFFGQPNSTLILARSAKNEIFGWGSKHFGQPGPFSSERVRADRDDYLKPSKIGYFNNKNIFQISYEVNHCLALSGNGFVYGWGSNDWGQTGCGTTDHIILNPIQIAFSDDQDVRIKHIDTYFTRSGAITLSGEVYCWGQVKPNYRCLRPILVLVNNISKIFMGFSDYTMSLLTTKNEVIIFNDLGDSQKVLDTTEFIDIERIRPISDDLVLKSIEGVYEFKDEEIIKTEYANFFEYYLHKHQRIEGTIHVTNDGYLKKYKIEVNENYFENSDEMCLKQIYENIFDLKYLNSFGNEELIGQGAFGTVFKVKNLMNNQWYAIKRLKIKSKLAETVTEIRILSKLNSDYVVKYINSWIEAKVIDRQFVHFMYIQMELCSQSLKTVIHLTEKSFDTSFKDLKYFIRSELLLELIECLNYLHSSKPPIIHRDLKPENVLVTDGTNGRFLKLCDFGLAKVFENSLNTPGLGTRGYMAPELIDDHYYDSKSKKSFYTIKSDIYSLGVIATKIFGLKDPIKSIRKQTVLKKYLLDYTNTDFDEMFRSLFETISLMLSKQPANRPDCQELLKYKKQWIVDKTNNLKTVKLINSMNHLMNTSVSSLTIDSLKRKGRPRKKYSTSDLPLLHSSSSGTSFSYTDQSHRRESNSLSGLITEESRGHGSGRDRTPTTESCARSPGRAIIEKQFLIKYFVSRFTGNVVIGYLFHQEHIFFIDPNFIESNLKTKNNKNCRSTK